MLLTSVVVSGKQADPRFPGRVTLHEPLPPSAKYTRPPTDVPVTVASPSRTVMVAFSPGSCTAMVETLPSTCVAAPSPELMMLTLSEVIVHHMEMKLVWPVWRTVMLCVSMHPRDRLVEAETVAVKVGGVKVPARHVLGNESWSETLTRPPSPVDSGWYAQSRCHPFGPSCAPESEIWVKVDLGAKMSMVSAQGHAMLSTPVGLTVGVAPSTWGVPVVGRMRTSLPARLPPCWNEVNAGTVTGAEKQVARLQSSTVTSAIEDIRMRDGVRGVGTWSWCV